MDWVKAHFDCSPGHAWIMLRDRLKADVVTWQELAKENGKLVRLSEDGTDKLTVTREVAGGEAWVTISLAREERVILYKSTVNVKMVKDIPTHRLLPIVNENGVCRLRYEGNDLEFWQASRTILEPLLFMTQKHAR